MDDGQSYPINELLPRVNVWSIHHSLPELLHIPGCDRLREGELSSKHQGYANLWTL